MNYNMKTTVRFLGLLFVYIGIALSSYGQNNITVSSAMGQNPNTLILNVLAGEGVELSNGKFNNSNANITYPQIGTFNKNNSAFPFQSGLIMTTGNINVAPGPNTLPSASQAIASYYTDSQLAPLATSTLSSCAVLEFDFLAYADTFSFNYIFASEEYPEYVCSSFNDVFAFFLTGIDPVTYVTTTRNVAIIPNTITAANPNGIPVTINSVNNGQPGTSGTGGSGCYYNNTQYYNSNPPGVEYDGSTVSLSAAAFILACQPYHMHLTIGNVGDNAYDSGVFLEEGSFYSPSLQIESLFDLSGHIDTLYADTLIQNCREADVLFSLPRPNATAYTTNFNFGGTAVINQDYSFVTADGSHLSSADNTFSFQQDTLVQVHLAILPDAVFPQGQPKTIELYIETVFCEVLQDARKIDTLRFVLLPNDSVHLKDTAITGCHVCDHVLGIVESGSGSLNYEWLPATGIDNPHALESDANITQSTVYKLVASDRYGCLSDTANIEIIIHDIPDIAQTISPTYGCVPLQVGLQVNNPSDDYDYVWITSRDSSFADTARTAEHYLTLDEQGYYDVYLWASSAPACNDSIFIEKAIHVSDYPHAGFTYAPDEPQNGKEVFFYNTSTGDDIVSYLWTFGDGTFSTERDPVHIYHLPNNDKMTVRLKVNNVDECADDTAVVVPVVDNFAFWVPNSFTPNNDGKNDVFLPKVHDVAYYKLQIYNRFGQLLFSTTNVEAGWDGTINRTLAPAGVYKWKIDYVRYSNMNETIKKTGCVNLIR